MSITIQCKKCGKRYNLPDDKGGKRFKCRNCQNTIIIPTADADEWMDESGEPDPPKSPTLPHRRKPNRGSGRKSKSSKRRSKSPSPIVYGALGIAVLIGLVLAIVFFNGNGEDTTPNANSSNETLAEKTSKQNQGTQAQSNSGASEEVAIKEASEQKISSLDNQAKRPSNNLPTPVATKNELEEYDSVDRFSVANNGKFILTYGTRKASSTNGDGTGRVGELRVWDITNGESVAILKTNDLCKAIALDPLGRIAATIPNEDGGPVYIWDATTGKELKMLESNSANDPNVKGFDSVEFSHDSSAVFLAAGSSDAIGESGMRTRIHRIIHADVETGNLDVFEVENVNFMMPMAVSPVSDVLALGVVQRDQNGKAFGGIQLRDSKTGGINDFIKINGVPQQLAYSSDGRWLAATLAETKLLLIDAQTSEIQSTVSTPVRVKSFGYENLTISPTGRYAMAKPMHQGKPIPEFWNLQTKKVVQFDATMIRRFVFLADDKIITSQSSKIRVLTPNELVGPSASSVL